MAFGGFGFRPLGTRLSVSLAAEVFPRHIFLGVGWLDFLKMPNGFSLIMIYSSLHLHNPRHVWPRVGLTFA